MCGGTNIDILRRKVYGFPPDATDEAFEDEDDSAVFSDSWDSSGADNKT